tara:strand:+ start:1664 stop:2860 length:1197 start_codon:yes stop_codon:yes gene_type:complete
MDISDLRTKRRSRSYMDVCQELPPLFYKEAQQQIPPKSSGEYNPYKANRIIAARLHTGGVEEIYSTDELTGDFAVALDKSNRRENLGRPIHRTSLSPLQARDDKNKLAREYKVFAEKNRIRSTRQIRVAPPNCIVPLTSYREIHRVVARQLNRMVSYFCERNDCHVDLIGTHFSRDRKVKDCGYLHFHVVFRGTGEQADEFVRYLETGRKNRQAWNCWIEEGANLKNLSANVAYVAGGAAASAQFCGWTHAQLAELYRQTHGLALTRARGEFRKFLGELSASDLVVTADGVIRKKFRLPQSFHEARRRNEFLFTSVGFRVLRIVERRFRDANGKLEPFLRRAAIVRGDASVTERKIREIYDIAPSNGEGPQLRINAAMSQFLAEQFRPDAPPPRHDPG